MRRGSLEKLRAKQWVKIPGNSGLECAIIPSAGSTLRAPVLTFQPRNDVAVYSICRHCFVDFRGFDEDDGTPVENTVEARVQLFQEYGPISNALLEAVNEFNEQVTLGEGGGDSDSPDTSSP